MSISINTISNNWQKAFSSNGSNAAFPSRVPTAVEPTKATHPGLVRVSERNGGIGPNGIVIVPYGAGTADNTFSVRLIGWRCLGLGVDQPPLWVPVPLSEHDCTLGTTTGVAGTQITASELFADTIAEVLGGDGATEVSPEDNTIGHIAVDVKGFVYVEILTETGSSATSANALFATV